jgi:hypothetical protein
LTNHFALDEVIVPCHLGENHAIQNDNPRFDGPIVDPCDAVRLWVHGMAPRITWRCFRGWLDDAGRYDADECGY